VRTHTRPPLAWVRDDSVAKFNGITVTFRITIKLKSKSIRRIKHSHNHQYRQCKSFHRITYCSTIQLNAKRLAGPAAGSTEARDHADVDGVGFGDLD
jgi:hypothetical protein